MAAAATTPTARAATDFTETPIAPLLGAGEAPEPVAEPVDEEPPFPLTPDAVDCAAGRVEVTTAEVGDTLKEADPCSTCMYVAATRGPRPLDCKWISTGATPDLEDIS
jgi:hypothetical protein